MKKILNQFIVGAALVTGLTACNRSFTPQRAAETGGKTCRDHHRITQVETLKPNKVSGAPAPAFFG